jgi:hypothetical protein
VSSTAAKMKRQLLQAFCDSQADFDNFRVVRLGVRSTGVKETVTTIVAAERRCHNALRSLQAVVAAERRLEDERKSCARAVQAALADEERWESNRAETMKDE